MILRRKSDTERQKQLGVAVERMLVKDYVDLLANPKRIIYSSLIRGIFTGLGTVIGATVMVALVLWLLSLANDLPFVGRIFESLQHTINSAKK